MSLLPPRGTLRLVVDRILPDRPVTRTVRGVEMHLPRRHWLPHMAAEGSPYAQNLVDLAVLLHAQESDTRERLVVLDVGANVGDSTLLIRDRVPVRAVCVEGDPQWLAYLHRNVDALDEVAVEPVLLSGDGDSSFVSIVHAEVGSSHLLPAEAGEGVPTVPAAELAVRHPELAEVRLVKTDTDGFDVLLAPALARAFAASRPVVFLEYDPRPTRLATPDLEPASVWTGLAEAGYEQAVVWTNGGQLIGASTVAELLERSAELERTQGQRSYDFWDVAVAHRDDPAGQEALTGLVRAARWPWSGGWS